jgi:hypothetical protein
MNTQDVFPDLFFAFPDGVLHHACPECTALCCRGQGFAGSKKREMDFIFKNYPQFGGMVQERDGDVITCATPMGRCFFLRDDNLCQIEVSHGREKKPGVCLLFPFNDFYRIGTALAVAPHFMCPIRLVLPAAPGRVEGTHAAIGKTIRETGLLGKDSVKAFVGDAVIPPGVTASAVLAREIAFRDLCGAALGNMRFRDVVEASSDDKHELRAYKKRVAQLMGWTSSPMPAERDAIDDVLLATASSHRLSLLHHSPEGLLRFLSLAEMLVRRVFTVGQAPPALQAVCSVIEDMRPGIRLLAWADEKPALKNVTLKSPKFNDPNLVYAGNVFLNNMPKRGVLKSLEKAFNSSLPPADRNALVHQVAGIVDPALKHKQPATAR